MTYLRQKPLPVDVDHKMIRMPFYQPIDAPARLTLREIAINLQDWIEQLDPVAWYNARDQLFRTQGLSPIQRDMVYQRMYQFSGEFHDHA